MRMEDLVKINSDLPFDIVDDLAIYMRNDPTFYRKIFFPAVIKMKNCYEQNKKFNAKKELFPIIDRAAGNYCKKFKIERRPEDLLNDKDRQMLAKKLYSEEMTNIKKGTYNK